MHCSHDAKMIGHYSRNIDSNLSVTHHKLTGNSLDLQCLTSCSNLLSLPKIYVLKVEQIEAVESLLAGHDVLSNLPTGFGKSLIYQVFCLAKLNKILNGSLLVVLRFNSIVKEQVRN